MEILFFILSLLLLLFHSIFFLRALYYKKAKFSPQNIDRISKLVSTVLLLPTFIVGSIVIQNVILSIIIYLPIILIIISNFNKSIVRKNPYILPSLNLGFILLTLLFSINELVWH